MAQASAAQVPPPLPHSGPTLLGHPRALFVLFFTEMWERFNYYGMRALLVLYMTKSLLLGYGDARAYAVYGAFTTLVYLTPIVGGWIADRYFGYRKAVITGGLFMAAGEFTLMLSNETAFYVGLALIIIGNGFFKPNISSMVGKLYAQGDGRRDRGFTIFYMGINLGAFLAPLVCGLIGEKFGWHLGFMLAGLGMLLGLACFTFFQRVLGEVGLPPTKDKEGRELVRSPLINPMIWLGAMLAVPLAAFLLNQTEYTKWTLYALSSAMLLVILAIAFREGSQQRHRIFLYLCLWLFHCLFWALFEQAGSSLTLFAERNVDRHVLGAEISTSTFQSVNPLFIVALGPVFSLIWAFLQRRNWEPNIPAKFGMGLILLALGFLVVVVGSRQFATDGLSPVTFLLLMYMLHTLGELAISPVGLSAVTKLVPANSVGFFMGCWFLSISFGQFLAGKIAGETSVPADAARIVSAEIYSGVYWQSGLVILAVGVFLIVVSGLLGKLSHGVK